MKGVAARILLVAGSTIFAICLLEVGLRFLGPPPASEPLIPDPVLDHVKLRDFAFKSYSPDNEFAPFVVYWDPEGRVADPEKKIAWNPARHTRNVALVGDSFVEASQVPYSKSFAGMLNRAAAPDVFFSNWGVSSYSPMVYVPLWRNRILGTRPTHVFLLLYENDVNDDSVYSTKAKFGADGLPLCVVGKPEPPVLAWIRRSSLFRALRFATVKIRAGFAAKNNPRVADAGQYQEVSPDISPLTARMILGLKKEVEDNGSQLTLLAVPSRRADILGDPPDGPVPFASRAGAWCRENHVDYIDLEGPFLASRKAHGNSTLFFKKDIHFTAAAHRVVAGAIMGRYPEYFVGPLPEDSAAPVGR
ncbi:MAG: hypothetical protein WC003_00785 [Terrimicrobiaceae bacterium]